MDWRPEIATWMACWAGTFGHSRVPASNVKPSRKPSACPFGPVMTNQPER